jgi:hypothetical protein
LLAQQQQLADRERAVSERDATARVREQTVIEQEVRFDSVGVSCLMRRANGCMKAALAQQASALVEREREIARTRSDTNSASKEQLDVRIRSPNCLFVGV